jgi:GNAT superfamily N-acetyltransferase
VSDGLVRPGRPGDEIPLAAAQVQAWSASYAGILPAEVLTALDAATLADTWGAALRDPAASGCQVLVAVESDTIAGFAAVAPGHDADADTDADLELLTLVVAPAHRGRGHGSRLLSAAADTARAGGRARAYAWLPTADESGGRFLGGAGWGPDGAVRTLDLRGDGAVLVEYARWHTDVRPAS